MAWAIRKEGDGVGAGHVPNLVHSTHTYLPVKMEQTVFQNVGT